MLPWSIRRGGLIGLWCVSMLLITACSNPIESRDATETPGTQSAAAGSPAVTATRVAELPIVTATPVPAGATVPVPDESGIGTGEENPDTYIVQEGDTLYGIALRFGVEIRSIIELNGLSDPNDIQAGQELKIPARE